ncbi:MAG: hypothetical protein A2Y07_07235 [Planctomycetes bacterium GWF2_50_10]|nr:MAG: hypothetical protein A2Y07_07235 [Planctomycetes bacterium GWF2_50_10]
MAAVLDICKALADPNRLRILMSLRDGELCVCQITEMLALAPSTVSKHLLILKQAGMVESSKRGRWIYYTLLVDSTQTVPVMNWLKASLTNDNVIKRDHVLLKKILSENPTELCCQQRTTRGREQL